MASFGYGWPKVLSPKLHNESLSLESETFYPIDLVIDEHRSKLAVLYDDRVVFWTTGRIRVVTGKLSLCRYNKEKGSVKGCCFRYDGNRCAILLERSFLLIYKLEPFHAPPGRSSWFDFVSSSEGNSQEKESQSTNKWADEYILPILLIEKDISSSEEESILACKSCPSGIILVNSTLEVICVSWEGELFWRTSIGRLLSLDTIGCENGRSEGSVSLDYHNGTDLCGLTLNFSGVALLLKVGEEGHSLPGIDDCFILRENDASCIALEPQQCLAAVGLRNGSVEIYNTSVFLTGQPVCLRSLSLDSLYFSVSDIGRVVSLQWTSDGNCIAVGYEKAGVVVWSNFGHCVFHTFSSFEHPKEEMRYLAETIQEMQNNHEQLGQTDPSSSIYGETKMESFKQGYLFRHTKAVCWGAFGYSLFVLGSIDYTRNHWEAQSFVPFLLFELSFLKTGFSKGSCQNEATRSFLLGPDFFVSEDNAMIHYPDMMSSKKKMIRHIEAPYEYVSNNWPLRSISVNDDKSFVAVSGKHGVAIYNTRSRRWRLFGDVVEERMIQCCSLCWYGRSIIIGNELAIQNRKTHRYELLIFPRDSLYFSAIQAQIPLQGAPLLLDARKDGFVLVFADDLQLRLLKLESDRSKTKFTYSTCWTFHITVEAPLASPRRITRWRSCGTFVSSVRLYPKQPCENDIPYQVLLLKSTGSLILLDISNGISVPLLRMVHSFWFHNTDCLPVGTVNSPPLIIWAVAEEGIYCLFDSSCTQVDSVSPSLTQSPSNMAYNSRFVSHKWFHGDLNIYPLGVVGFGGFLAGVCPLQTASVTITLDNIYCRLPCFGIQIERQEFISKLFLCWLADETLEDMQCLKWMESCSEWEHFENCLERCLYELLIHVEAKRNNRSLSHEETSELQVMEPLPSTSLTFSINEEYALDRFMRLAKYFGEYEDVIVGCARKMDRKYWNLLFSYVGEPCLLFENCCLTKRLTIAAAFLKVIQEWWDLQVAAMHAWRLLQSCLNEERIDIAEQVVLFLGRAAMEGLFSYPDFEIREEDKRLLENGVVVGCNDDRAVHPVNALLLQNMGKCLERMQWRQALNISMCFGISLADYWKVMESSFQYKPLSHVLLSLHNSFQWPFPSSDVVCKKWRLLGEDLLVSNEEQVFEKLYDWKKITFQYEKLNGYKEQWELVLCGLTMLLSCEELRVLLNLHTGWVASYVEGLEKTHIAGYATLASKWYS
ncbi:RAB6A-GEF complex partner protein 1 [Galdieria sulphuraria]|nr:RAB6A-GEF complex partner protein 1 [Galdieria sulphuraria]